jgi:hypothetical protein
MLWRATSVASAAAVLAAAASQELLDLSAYVGTSGGYIHRDCIHQNVASVDAMNADGDLIVFSDGTAGSFGRCEFPALRFSKTGASFKFYKSYKKLPFIIILLGTRR